jgi:regulator of CtrA degradation
MAIQGSDMAKISRTDPALATDLTFTEGKVFEKVFVEGMALVEETAAYLDGPGRQLSATLPREASLTYAAWSMELTTRLMQAASWLVMQKAVRDGEMDRGDANQKKYRISRDEPALEAGAQRGKGLPDVFLDLVERSEALFERICRLDAAIYGHDRIDASSPVSQQLAELRKAAETGAFDPLKVWGKAR